MTSHHHDPNNEFDQLRGIIKNLIQDNDEFVRMHTPQYFYPFEQLQHLRATVVTCHDALVHTYTSLRQNARWRFVYDTQYLQQNYYGRRLGRIWRAAFTAPFLIIVWHLACGAIKAAAGNYSSESDAIKHELNSIQLPIKTDELTTEDWLRGVIANVNNQVNYALIKFADEVKEQILTVVGAVYDFQNVLGQGQGRLVNGMWILSILLPGYWN